MAKLKKTMKTPRGVTRSQRRLELQIGGGFAQSIGLDMPDHIIAYARKRAAHVQSMAFRDDYNRNRGAAFERAAHARFFGLGPKREDQDTSFVETSGEGTAIGT